MMIQKQFPDLSGTTQLPALAPKPAPKGGPKHPLGKTGMPHPLKGGKCK